MPYYQSRGSVPPKRHTQHRGPSGQLRFEELMGEEGFSSDSTLLYAVILDRYGEPDWGPIYAGYLALALHASLLVAVGLLMSSITESQVVAAALSIGSFLMLWFADSVSYLLPPPFDSFAINLSLIGHFKPMVSGSVFLSDIGYFVTASMLALFLTAWGLAQR